MGKCRVGRGPTGYRGLFKGDGLQDAPGQTKTRQIGLIPGTAQRIQDLPSLFNGRLSLYPIPFYLQLGQHPLCWGIGVAEEVIGKSLEGRQSQAMQSLRCQVAVFLSR